MTTETLEYETPHFLQSLFAGDLTLLKALERDAGIRITTREGWIKLQGNEEGVAAGKRVFEQLEKARRRGTDINEHFFRFAMENARHKGPSVNGGSAESKEAAPGTSLDDLTGIKIVGSPRKPPVMARTPGQLAYLHAIRAHDVTFGIGPAGTGKTFLAVASAVAAYKAGDIQRIVLSRPAVEAGEALGFLPGDLNEKVLPYLRPLYDALYDILEPAEIEKMIDQGQIEIAPLAYMRGRTLSRSFIILDEAQNTTQSQMLMFLTRIGEKSKCAVTGDPSQIDLKDPRGSGLREAMRILPGIEGIAFCEFAGVDVVRHKVLQRIISAYDKARGDF
jgi:phosphate starvation-inducible protein PhoH and related proteins